MLLVLLRASFPHRMPLLAALFLLALALSLLVLNGGSTANAGATSSYQTPPTPSAQPTSSQPTQQSTPQATSQPTTKPILLTDPVPNPKQPGVQYFAPTGHTLRGSFLDYWNKNGGLAQFGYPLTEEFTEPLGPNNSPVMVQYFERNRFEHHPENAGTQYEVLLGTLGREFHQQDPPVQPLPSPALFFPQTGHNLSGTFKAYWETHGGLAVNGYPITEQFQERSPTDGKLYMVQYFERSRMELHPENAGSPYEVLLGQLGVQLAQKKGYPYGWYPQYGHAADYSWVSGRLLPPRACFTAECSCPLFAFGQPNEVAKPWGPGWTVAVDKGIAKSVNFLVLFGQRQSSAEQYPVCKPNFSVSQVQMNPSDESPH